MINSYLAKYINKLLNSKRKNTNKKGKSALEFYFYSEYYGGLSSTKWAKRWNVSRSTSYTWCKEFEEEYENALLF